MDIDHSSWLKIYFTCRNIAWKKDPSPVRSFLLEEFPLIDVWNKIQKKDLNPHRSYLPWALLLSKPKHNTEIGSKSTKILLPGWIFCSGFQQYIIEEGFKSTQIPLPGVTLCFFWFTFCHLWQIWWTYGMYAVWKCQNICSLYLYIVSIIRLFNVL